MRSLQTLLAILDGQHLTPGYLPTFGSGTALETLIGLKNQFDPFTLRANPITPPAWLFTPAWVASLKGQNAIYLAGVDGNLDVSKGQAAYVLA